MSPPGDPVDRPGLNAGITYLRPFDRSSLLGVLAGLGIFVSELDSKAPTPAGSLDLYILVIRGKADLPAVRDLAANAPVLIVIAPTAALATEVVAAGASFCVADPEILRDPRGALALAARLARQRRLRGHDGALPRSTIHIGPVMFSSDSCSLWARGTHIPLSRTERDVLRCLAEEPGVPVRSEVLAGAARLGILPTSRYLSSVIVRLRRKLRQLGADEELLATVHGVGYVLLMPPAAERE